MELLKEQIRRYGKVLPGNIVKVDGFLNHRIDISLNRAMAKEFKEHFKDKGVTLILTIEASGISLASIVADEFGVPMLFAKKAKSDNIEGGLLKSEIFSYTYNKKVTLMVSKEWISPDDKVLIIDDFLANGEAIRGAIEIVEQSGAELVGVGIAVEKGFQNGGQKVRDRGIDILSLAIIEKADENGIVFRD